MSANAIWRLLERYSIEQIIDLLMRLDIADEFDILGELTFYLEELEETVFEDDEYDAD